MFYDNYVLDNEHSGFGFGLFYCYCLLCGDQSARSADQYVAPSSRSDMCCWYSYSLVGKALICIMKKQGVAALVRLAITMVPDMFLPADTASVLTALLASFLCIWFRSCGRFDTVLLVVDALDFSPADGISHCFNGCSIWGHLCLPQWYKLILHTQ